MNRPELTVLDGELYIRAEALGPLLQLGDVRWDDGLGRFEACATGLDGRGETVRYRATEEGVWELEYADGNHIAAAGVVPSDEPTFEQLQLMLLRHNIHLPSTQRPTGETR
ncbi:hypothetical protein [Deinococcus petrolearius]|uniref:Uncharacterized protein n=1 Tax=Deinococcus petrolearius TaxID=1751295 RepID=A0ABW1DFV3_9DEIO